jgi:DNA-binding transcriptional LysR family regulator
LEYGLFATPEYLQRHGRPREPAELRAHALVMFAPGGRRSGWQLVHADSGEVQRFDPPARLRVNNGFAVRDAVLRHLGLGQLPLLIAAAPEVRARLVRVLPDWAGAPVPVHAVYPSNRYLSPKVRAFIDLALLRLPERTLQARAAEFAAAPRMRAARAAAR